MYIGAAPWKSSELLTPAKGYPLTGEADEYLQKEQNMGIQDKKGKKKEKWIRRVLVLLSYKARIDGQSAPQKLTMDLLLTCYLVEPTGISIWVFPTVKHNMKCTGISERECQTHSCLGVTVMKKDAEVLQSTQSSQNKEEIGKD